MAASQSRAVLSQLPVRIVLPSGLKATDLTLSPWEKSAFELDELAPPGRQVGQGDVPAGLVVRPSVAIRSDSTVQSIPTPIWPLSKATWPRSRSSIASRRFDSDRAVL